MAGRRGRRKGSGNGGICAPYREKIIELAKQGFNMKEMLPYLEKEGLYISYEALAIYCKKTGIKTSATRICDYCRYDERFPVMSTNRKDIRICKLYGYGHYAKTVPRWCDDGFERKD